MSTYEILEHYLTGDYQSVACPTEADYYALWHERGLDSMGPIDCALAGALLADRLPWVFTAGYQGTLRNAFPNLKPGGWAAFAATEDAHDPQAHPGTRLQDGPSGFLLSGCKSWVAHSRCVDQLIITINDEQGDKRKARGLVIDSKRRGISLTHREQPGFLGSLSQGFAKFDSTEVAVSEVFEFAPIRLFGRTEAKFVMLASAAFMLGRVPENHELRDRLIAVAGALISLITEQQTSRQVYAAIDREFQRCVDAFEACGATDTITDYAADRRLFRMYTNKIQRRGEYSRNEAAGRADD